MDFMSNLLRKTSIKTNSVDEEKLEGETDVKKDDEKKSENTGIGVNFVSNIIKSTFKSDSSGAAAASEHKIDEDNSGTIEETNSPTNKNQESGFMSSVWKTASIFKSDTSSNSDANERKESISENATDKKDEGSAASHFMSNVFSKSTSLFRSDTAVEKEKRKGSQTESGDIEKESFIEEEKEQVSGEAGENVFQKPIDSAKHFGSFLYSVANKAGQTVSATAKQIKHTVESNTFLADFTKEQQDFIKDHGGNIHSGDAPWIGCENESEVKEQIISLSQDRRNFVRSPPSGVHFDFTMKDMLPVALTLLKEDENLGKMRYDIVPKLVNEETFWRNYFYRVSLIKQSTSLSTMNKDKKGWASSSSSSAEGPDEPSPTNPEHEFISDSTDADLKKGNKQMSVDKSKKSLEEKNWEEEITKELQEFEVVNSDVNTGFDAELEKDLAAL